MQNVRWVADVDPDTFFPKCFNLTDDDMFEEFIEQFKLIKAETILKKYLKNIESNKKQFDNDVVETALNICKRRLLTVDDFIDDQKLA